ncbi:potassium transporter Kup [Niastella koreensis]|uniref:Probable potassium transport system protein Kup n=2 Tax=Niastella koreensis TaxID=354356 RepID=G8TA98_NIAKG|nr:KUP/HAK/KT family potassium transporter [Niastella koreensis]AEV97045.1 Low affinity potassium transport system protein kup [Niastella koreensis GR20-10]OQP39264.1 potassium transporter Kup [Niastella koreensis]
MSKQLNKVSLAGLLITLGIIYGDIGTSPLYVLKSIIGSRPITDELIYGGLSCVLWTLTLQTTFKYILLTLQADNRGEGGIFSLFALVRRYRHWLFLPAIIGAGTLLADGIITPPISVSSAIEGLNGVSGLEKYIVPGNTLTVSIIIGIISILFFFQQFGTKVVGSAFGPMMLIWFTMIGVLGISQIAHYPQILKAINPVYAYNLLVHYPNGFWLLGAVFLCTTGAEALYSDLGHCGKRNIQVSWIFVKTTLLLNYFGQGAWVLLRGKPSLNDLNPFYEIMPHSFLLIGIIISTAATIIASQALISGSFTLINEAMRLIFWPKIKVKYPTNIRGQIYIPSINWILWFGCIAVMLYFRESSHMEAAYGFSITIAMLMTTILMFYYMKFHKKWHAVIISVVLMVFLTVEISFFIANVAKIKQRWMFLVFEVGIIGVMYIWYRARKIKNRYVELVRLEDYIPMIHSISRDRSIPKYTNHLVYLTSSDNRKEVEHKIVHSILAKAPKRADIYWFVHVHTTDDPYRREYEVTHVIPNSIIRIELRLGFRIDPDVHLMFRYIIAELITNKEVVISGGYDAMYKHNPTGDIHFIVMEKYLSSDNELPMAERMIMDFYFRLKKISLSEARGFGLDPANLTVEKFPLMVSPVPEMHLKRI